MRFLPIVAIGTVVALGLGGAAYAATRDEDEPPLPIPEGDICSTAADVGNATSEILADNTVDAKGLRDAAEVLRNWTYYCDEAAKKTGAASIALLEAKATQLEQQQENPGPVPQVGYTWPVPPGYESSASATGLHGETGTVYTYGNGDQWFYPSNPLLIPYYIPGGSKDIKTQGGCIGCDSDEGCGCGR